MSKIATDLEQSKRLREILPAESADMVYPYNPYDPSFYFDVPSVRCGMPNDDYDILAWSLSALLDILDDTIDGENGETYNLRIYKENSEYELAYSEEHSFDDDIETDWHEDMVDACVEMILKLKEKNLI